MHRWGISPAFGSCRRFLALRRVPISILLHRKVLGKIMPITSTFVAEKIEEYLQHRITIDDLVDWAEDALMDGDFEEREMDSLRGAVARLGVADVRAFGLSWEDCEELLATLDFTARIEITAG